MRHYTELKTKDLIKAIVVAVVLLLAINGVYIFLNQWQTRKEYSMASNDTVKEFKTIEYNGQKYMEKPGLETYLFMGIDVSGPVKGNKSYIGGGQADTQIVFVLDKLNKTWQMLQINRDSMVEVPVLGVTGIEVSTEYQQIALAHSYGDGLTTSCKNNVVTVSRLLQNQFIDGYVSLNVDAIEILNDTVGGVEVTLLEDFTEFDETMIQGKTMTLNGKQAMLYLRGRKNIGDETNLSRMERQSQYLTALAEKIAELDSETFVNKYKEIADYTVTNMENKLLGVLQKMQTYQQLQPLTIKGENTKDEQGYTAYELDEDSLQQVILELFYQAV